MKYFEIVPRFFYEFLAYFVPGLIIFTFLEIYLHVNIIPYLSNNIKLIDSQAVPIATIIICSYVLGRLLYAIGDWSTKLLVKKICGDPDKYLLIDNIAILHKHVKDYNKHFKEKLQNAITEVLKIDIQEIKCYPYFKLCCEWIDLNAPKKSIFIQHHHTIEIFIRNIATATLLISIMNFYYTSLISGIGGLICYCCLVYYYYIRQVKRARSVYELFYVLYIYMKTHVK
jgi:hypothetical protein